MIVSAFGRSETGMGAGGDPTFVASGCSPADRHRYQDRKQRPASACDHFKHVAPFGSPRADSACRRHRWEGDRSGEWPPAAKGAWGDACQTGMETHDRRSADSLRWPAAALVSFSVTA